MTSETGSAGISPEFAKGLREMCDGLERLAAPLIGAVEEAARVAAPVADKLDQWWRGLSSDVSAQQWFQAFSRLEEGPPFAYESLLIDVGKEPLEARWLAHTIRHFGPLCAAELNEVPATYTAIRALARRPTGVKAISRQAGTLKGLGLGGLRPLHDVVEPELICELVSLIEPAVSGEAAACGRLKSIAQRIVPLLPQGRGRKVSAASLMHEMFMGLLQSEGGTPGYTRNPVTDDFTDRMTRATRIESGDPDLDPRPALRRLRTRALLA